MESIIYGIGWFITFVLSVTLHEAAHAWAAKRGGDLSTYMGGHSLNPLTHILREPLGMVVFPLIFSFLIGWPFGYASTPYNRNWAYNHPHKAAWMAAAGPVANVLLVVLSTIIIKLGILGGIFTEPYSVGFRHIVGPGPGGAWTGLSIFMNMIFTLNLIMFVFNLIPLPPLDGSNIISLCMLEDTARIYQSAISNQIFGFVGLFIAWLVFGPLFDLLFPIIINILY